MDTGIQGGGIESATPLVLTDKTMDGVRLFLSDEDAQTVSDAYTYDNGIWTLGDTARQPELEPVFIRPLVMYARLSEQGANTVLALRRQMQGGLITREEILARGEEALSGMGVLTDSVLRSAAMQFLKTEYAVAGLNVNHMRTSYLLRTGGQMLLLTFGMIAAAVLCSYVGAKMSAAIGRDLRAQVFRKVLSFSSAEMDKFSTASLITRSTNDVTQIQAVCVMLVRIVLYAPIIGLGGVVMVARTKTGLGWVIALAVAAMLLLVGVLMKIAMPQFRAMQQRVDDVNLVSREILTGLPVIRAFHRERHEQERFDTASRRAHEHAAVRQPHHGVHGTGYDAHHVRRHGHDRVVRRQEHQRRTYADRRHDRLFELCVDDHHGLYDDHDRCGDAAACGGLGGARG